MQKNDTESQPCIKEICFPNIKKNVTKTTQHNFNLFDCTTAICFNLQVHPFVLSFVFAVLFLPFIFLCFFLYSRVDYLLTDTSVKRTPRVGACHSLLPLQPTVTFKTGIKSPS